MSRASTRWPPAGVLVAALVAAALRAVPFLRALSNGGEGFARLPIGYIPKDWLQYAAMVRDHPGTGWLTLVDPFTTAPQDSRFVLLLLQALGAIHRLTGANPLWLLELSRPPLILAFAAALWWFTGRIFADDRTRRWACLLVLFSGGLELFVAPVLPLLPEGIADLFRRDTWTAFGWSTFASLYNPLWIAGFAMMLLALGPALAPGGPRTRLEAAGGTTGLLLLWLTHPYSAMAAVGAIMGASAAGAIAGGSAGRRSGLRAAAMLAPALLGILLVAVWQLGDPVFRATASNAFGAQAASPLWYPVTLGALGVFTVIGFRGWLGERHPWRWVLAGWVAAVAVMHSLPAINGYHFLPYLHLPICLAAAPAVARAFERRRAAWAVRAILAVLLFSSAAHVTASDVARTGGHRIETSLAALIARLESLPPGNALSSPEVGNLVPAFTSHRVWVGHWFLTPDFLAKAEVWGAIAVGGPGAGEALRGIVERERIDYLVLPAERETDLVEALGHSVAARERFGNRDLVRLERRAP